MDLLFLQSEQLLSSGGIIQRRIIENFFIYEVTLGVFLGKRKQGKNNSAVLIKHKNEQT